MPDTVTTIVVAILGGDKPSATTTSDIVSMVLTVAVAVLLLWRGVEAVSFLGGLWVGATLIQLYFHNFHSPVSPERAAPPQTSPLKQMSYAIQDAPWRPWPQIVALIALAAYSLIAMT